VTLQLRRIILFTQDLDTLIPFYRDVMGLPLRKGSAKEGWVEFDGLALHRGKARPGNSKLAFGSADVKKTREELLARGAKMGKVKDFGDLVLCEGRDPDGNPFQISSRA
jgi:catechol 2,3-dioxygenase-like lactoylglutathione lyase family enzyme